MAYSQRIVAIQCLEPEQQKVKMKYRFDDQDINKAEPGEEHATDDCQIRER